MTGTATEPATWTVTLAGDLGSPKKTVEVTGRYIDTHGGELTIYNDRRVVPSDDIHVVALFSRGEWLSIERKTKQEGTDQ